MEAITPLIDNQLLDTLERNGYSHVGVYDGKVCGLHQYAFTWAIVVGLDEFGYERRYCYETYDEAFISLIHWHGFNHPPGPWLVCKGKYKGNVVNLSGPGA